MRKNLFPEIAPMFVWQRILVICLVAMVLVSIGCQDETTVAPTDVGALPEGPDLPLPGVVPTTNEQTGLTELTQGETVADEDDTSLEEDVQADAAQAQRESEKIEPYTGPPIYLPDTPEPPPATIVDRQVAAPLVKYEDGSIHIERQVTRYSDNRIVNDGAYREYFPNGQVFVEGQYQEGKQEGEWTYWYENGQNNRIVTYKAGLPDGTWEVFREDGTKQAVRSYLEGRRHGEWTRFDPTGERPYRTFGYQNGLAHGEWKQWHPNGVQQNVITFDGGRRHGVTIEWDEEGNKRLESNYQDGQPHGETTRWNPDGSKSIQTYENGRLIRQTTE